MTTILSAEDVRRLVMEPWCNECNAPIETLPDATHEHDNTRQALWGRCPGCQPEVLTFEVFEDDEINCEYLGHNEIGVVHTIDLILMSIARDATAKFESIPHSGLAPWRLAYDAITFAVMSADLRDATKWRHQLKDIEAKS